MSVIEESGNVVINIRRGLTERGDVHIAKETWPGDTTKMFITLPLEEGEARNDNVAMTVTGNTCVHFLDDGPEWTEGFVLKTRATVVNDQTGLRSDGAVFINCTGNTFIKLEIL